MGFCSPRTNTQKNWLIWLRRFKTSWHLMEINVKYHKDHGDSIPNPTLYRWLVGSLIYLTTTCPNTSYTVNIVSQFMTDPQHRHLTSTFCIIRYLRGAPGCGLLFLSTLPLRLTAYADASIVKTLVAPPMDGVCFWVIPSFHRNVRNKSDYLNLQRGRIPCDVFYLLKNTLDF